jgi:hypothetical protein
MGRKGAIPGRCVCPSNCQPDVFHGYTKKLMPVLHHLHQQEPVLVVSAVPCYCAQRLTHCSALLKPDTLVKCSDT